MPYLSGAMGSTHNTFTKEIRKKKLYIFMDDYTYIFV